MLLSRCAHVTGGELINGDCEFSRLSTDTRSIQAGDLFLALKGERFDAHNFLQQAVQAGARALVVEQPDHTLALPQLVVKDTTKALGQIGAAKREEFNGVLIAITGSSGKTTVKGMLAAILACCGAVRATRGNLNNHIGVPLTLMTLQSTDRYAVVEMGANGLGEIGYLANLASPSVALVNNVMPAHLEGFGSIEGVAQEKSQIYGPVCNGGSAVINLDDNYSEYFVQQSNGSQRWGFSVSESLQSVPPEMRVVRARNIKLDSVGRASFTLEYENASTPIALAVMGRHNVHNALAAATCALAAGASADAIRQGLATFSGEPGRMQLNTAWNGATLVDDTYNANPGSVRAAIDFLANSELPTFLVLGNLGELGDEAVKSHAQLGTYAKESGVDHLVTCGNLAKEAATAFGEPGMHFDTQEALADWMKQHMPASALVLVKGSRSSRMENVVKALSQTGEKQ